MIQPSADSAAAYFWYRVHSTHCSHSSKRCSGPSRSPHRRRLNVRAHMNFIASVLLIQRAQCICTCRCYTRDATFILALRADFQWPSEARGSLDCDTKFICGVLASVLFIPGISFVYSKCTLSKCISIAVQRQATSRFHESPPKLITAYYSWSSIDQYSFLFLHNAHTDH